MSKLVIEHLEKRFDDVVVVDHVSFVVEDGELLTVVGPSGCGKTTLLRMIAGFAEPTHGRIRIDDDVLSDSDRAMHDVAPENRDIGMVFQTYAVWPHMNVFNNVAYPLKLRKTPKAEIRERVHEVLELVHLAGFEKRMAFEMSGGQQQRVALARALVVKPRLLLLDEPFSNLDAVLRAEMAEEVKEIHEQLRITVVHVTHDQAEAMAMSDKVAVMKDGRLIQYDTPRRIYEHPVSTFVAGFIGSANILPARKEPLGKADTDGMMKVFLADDSALSVPYIRSEDTEGYIVFRAHDAAPGEEGGISAQVTGCQYLGHEKRWTLERDGRKLQMLTDPTVQLETGSVIPLTIRKAQWLKE